jgi:hypothetical protein
MTTEGLSLPLPGLPVVGWAAGALQASPAEINAIARISALRVMIAASPPGHAGR